MTNEQFEQIECLSKKLWEDINNGHDYSMVTYTEFLGIVTEVWERLQEDSVNEDLIDVAKQYVKEHVIGIDKVTFSIATDMFVSGVKCGRNQAMTEIQAQSMALAHGCPKESITEDLENAAIKYAQDKYMPVQTSQAFKAGAKWLFEKVNEALLSEVLPCFMHGGEADEVVAKLDEVLNQKK